jgi:hypothetical protein
MTDDLYQSIPHPALWADAILVAHACIVAYVVGGQTIILIGWWRRWSWVRNVVFRTTHVVTVAVVVLQAWLGRLCPLTVWERELRRTAGQAVHEQSFVEYWVGRALYWDLPWWVFIAVYTTFALLVVWTWCRLPPRRSL